MLDRPKQWHETPDIVIRLRARREAWTCIREEAASEIENLREDVVRLKSRLSIYVDKASLHDQARESETFWFRRARELEGKLDAAADIKELVDERDKLVSVICEHVAKRKEYFDRAEKALADLASARSALRHFADSLADMHGGDHHDDGCPDCAAMIEHAPAIAAARAEGGE